MTLVLQTFFNPGILEDVIGQKARLDRYRYRQPLAGWGLPYLVAAAALTHQTASASKQ